MFMDLSVRLIDKVYHHLHHYVFLFRLALCYHQRKGNKCVVSNSFGTIGTKFYGNKKIVSLKALQFFKIKELPSDVFSEMPNLKEVWLPATVQSHWYRTFLYSENVKIVVICSDTPFTDRGFFNINTLNQIPSDLKIYVPDSALARYREAWKDFPYQSCLHPLSEYHS